MKHVIFFKVAVNFLLFFFTGFSEEVHLFEPAVFHNLLVKKKELYIYIKKNLVRSNWELFFFFLKINLHF